ncbi:MAG: hypothetical protein ACOYH4_04260 [Saccharofermentanales bacterium]
MDEAVRQGGLKLDTYEGNYVFYRKCGFEPVSWTKFYDAWRQMTGNLNNRKENIIFFKYTGNKSTK